jgi:rare lipoprotein A
MRKAIGLSLALLFVATTTMAKETPPSHTQPAPNGKPKAAKGTKGKPVAARHRSDGKGAAGLGHRRRGDGERTAALLPPQDRYIGPVQVIGKREIGTAAWYGGRHIGRRMASGERLDAVHATAAHRSLPLQSLVRVTNLDNGRSVIAKITDRGPVSRKLLIDVSPSVADTLDMRRSGLATVAVEPVAPGPHPAH